MAQMSPVAWGWRPLRRYADFRGRAPRAEFWWFFLFMLIIYFAMMFLFIGTIGGLTASQVQPSIGLVGAIGGAGIIMILFWLALLIPTIAVQTRRLHDTNRSGWWIGGFYLLYLLYVVVTMGAAVSAEGGTDLSQGGVAAIAGAGLIAVAFFIYAIVLLIFFCLPGTRGPNRYGPDPYGQDVEQVFA